MKKALILLTLFFFLSVLIVVAIANDMEGLKKLQPLSEKEQAIYDEVKNDFTKLHEFIETRTYLRAVKNIMGPDWARKDIQPYLPKIKTLNKRIFRDVFLEYTVDQDERLLLFKIAGPPA